MSTNSFELLNLFLTISLAVGRLDPRGQNIPHGKSSSTAETKKPAEGCAGFGSCCPGKNVNCVGSGPSQRNKTSVQCFCDEDCLRLGDCCLDYRFTCKTIDCVLAEQWSEWSKCSRDCGLGAQKRVRQVLVQPKNGGARCPSNVERRKCEEFGCKQPPVIERKKTDTNEGKVNETASVVPAIYATWRMNVLYNPLQDIRQNLFLNQIKYASLHSNRKPSYCATFRVTETRSACQHQVPGGRSNSTTKPPSTRSLVVGQAICVECQPFGIVHRTSSGKCVGDGIVGRETSWNAVATPRCHGKWILTTQHQVPCQCQADSESSFIFV